MTDTNIYCWKVLSFDNGGLVERRCFYPDKIDWKTVEDFVDEQKAKNYQVDVKTIIEGSKDHQEHLMSCGFINEVIAFTIKYGKVK